MHYIAVVWHMLKRKEPEAQQERHQCARVSQFGNYIWSFPAVPKPGNEPSFQAWKQPLSTIAVLGNLVHFLAWELLGNSKLRNSCCEASLYMHFAFCIIYNYSNSLAIIVIPKECMLKPQFVVYSSRVHLSLMKDSILHQIGACMAINNYCIKNKDL